MFGFKNPLAKEATISSPILDYERLCMELVEKLKVEEPPLHRFVESHLCEACGLPKICERHFI